MKALRLSLLVSAVMAPALFAQQSAQSTVVIDMMKVVDPQDPSKSATIEWKESMENFQKEMQKEGKPLEDLQKKAEAEQKRLFEKKQKNEKITDAEQSSLMSMGQELQVKSQQIQAKFASQFEKFQKDFKARVDAAIKVVADKKGYAEVVYKETIAYAKNLIDITADVIAELNNKYAAEKRSKKMSAETPAKAAPAKA